MSSSYKVSSLELRNERKATQQWGCRVANDFVFNEILVYHETVYADNVVSNFSFRRSSSPQHHSKFLANLTCENVFLVRYKQSKTRPFICMIIVKFLSSSRHFNCDTTFAVTVYFLNESVRTLTIIRKVKVKTGYQRVELFHCFDFTCDGSIFRIERF